MFTEPTIKTPRPGDALDRFLTELLAEQAQLQTPVAHFSALKDRGAAGLLAPSLLPLTAPAAGEQYAFEVDLDACSGCKACVSACHALNGLDEKESWRDVGLIHGTRNGVAYQQTVTTACHHCAEPGCLKGCPVAAYEKDALTGIVRHLDDQCIGCSYCTLTCPYDVPKYNPRLGIVRKCDMCQQRLAVGEAPACAQACPTHAIRIVAVPVSGRNPDFLPQAPDGALTGPTTRYVSSQTIPHSAVAADAGRASIQPSHWPLALMLVLTQIGLGLLVGAPAPLPQSGLAFHPQATAFGWQILWSAHSAGLLLLLAGLACSALHLGQPLRAWRFFLGLGTSWLSREILAFGFLVPLAGITVLWPHTHAARIVLGGVGLLAITTSVMIYAVTGRREWTFWRVFGRFTGTSVIAACTVSNPMVSSLLLLGKLGVESLALKTASPVRNLLLRQLRSHAMVRLLLGGAFVAIVHSEPNWALVVLVASETAERLLFFRAVDGSTMPGLPASK